MKLLVLLLLLSFSISTFGALEPLPLGGKISIDKSSWHAKTVDRDFQKTMILIHKKHQDLQGYVLDGHPKTKESCPKKKKDKTWVICTSETDVKKIKSFQYVLERKVGKAFQKYIISFNVPKEKYSEYLPILKDFQKSLEKLR